MLRTGIPVLVGNDIEQTVECALIILLTVEIHKTHSTAVELSKFYTAVLCAMKMYGKNGLLMFSSC